jgi:hypothetical protein
MSQSYVKLGRHERTRQSRVHIPAHDHHMHIPPGKELLERDHDPGSLLSLAAGTAAQANVRLWKAKVFQKDLRHLIIVMLSCMDERHFGPGAGLCLLQDWRHFHEVWASARNDYEVHS